MKSEPPQTHSAKVLNFTCRIAFGIEIVSLLKTHGEFHLFTPDEPRNDLKKSREQRPNQILPCIRSRRGRLRTREDVGIVARRRQAAAWRASCCEGSRTVAGWLLKLGRGSFIVASSPVSALGIKSGNPPLTSPGALRTHRSMVAMQQAQAIGQAVCVDDHVNGAANGHAMGTQFAKVLGGGNSEFFSTQGHLLQLVTHAMCFVKAAVVLESAQRFGNDQVAHDQAFDAKVSVQSLRACGAAGSGRSRSRRSSRQESLVASHRVEVALPLVLAAQLAQFGLLLEPEQGSKPLLNRLALGLDPRGFQGGGH